MQAQSINVHPIIHICQIVLTPTSTATYQKLSYQQLRLRFDIVTFQAPGSYFGGGFGIWSNEGNEQVAPGPLGWYSIKVFYFFYFFESQGWVVGWVGGKGLRTGLRLARTSVVEPLVWDGFTFLFSETLSDCVAQLVAPHIFCLAFLSSATHVNCVIWQSSTNLRF